MDGDNERMIKVLSEQVANLAGEIALLKLDTAALQAEALAQSAINTVLTMRLCELAPDGKERTLSLLDVMAMNQQWTQQNATVAETVRHLRRLVHSQLELADPLTGLIISALQAKDAGPDRLSALKEWNAQATDDELSDDVRELLHRLSSEYQPKKPQG